MRDKDTFTEPVMYRENPENLKALKRLAKLMFPKGKDDEGNLSQMIRYAVEYFLSESIDERERIVELPNGRRVRIVYTGEWNVLDVEGVDES